MADIPYVDWDGLVYYDGKVKQFVAEEIELCLKVGGFTSFNNLPDPSRDNVNFLYKITEEFTSNSDFKIQDETYPANTWVQCTDFDNIFLYTIFNESTNIDIALDNYYTKDEVDNAINEKANEQPFVDDSYVTNALGGFTFGESVKGLTIAQMFEKLLNLKPTAIPENNVTKIIADAYPMFSGTVNDGVIELVFQVLPVNASAYADTGASQSGLYVNDTYTVAGYQFELPGGEDGNPMTVYIPQGVTLCNLYQWSDFLNTWIVSDMEYFTKTSVKNMMVNGTSVMYDIYEWNEEKYDGSIYTPTNWRLEIEVKDVTN